MHQKQAVFILNEVIRGYSGVSLDTQFSIFAGKLYIILFKNNPFSHSCIVKFSQLEPILFIEQALESFTFNLL